MHKFWDPGANAELFALNPVKQVQRNPPSVLLQYEFWPQMSAWEHSSTSERVAGSASISTNLTHKNNRMLRLSLVRQFTRGLKRATDSYR